MKNKFVLSICAVALLAGLIKAQQPQFQWAKNMGGNTSLEGSSITTDANGNVYSTGYFDGIIDFDPGSGTYTLASAGMSDVYITKMDASGNFIWARSLGGSSHETGYSISVDGSGNVYVCGHYYSNDFNPGSPSYTLSSNGNDDMFICKFNSAGNLQWARGFGDSGFDHAAELRVNSGGDIYFAGYFSGTVDFDPAPTVYTLSATGPYSIFFCKMNTSGNLVWANTINGNGSTASAITIDGSDNVYIGGYYAGTADFNPGVGIANMTGTNGVGLFVAKYTSAGAYVWAKSIDGNSGYQNVEGLAVDNGSNVIVSGCFNTPTDFDPSASVFTMIPTGIDPYICKLDVNGDFVWAKTFTGPYQDYGLGVATDASGNIYSTGLFAGTVDFDPGLASYTMTSGTNGDVFVSKLSPAGNFVFAYQFGNGNIPGIKHIHFYGNEIYLTGSFSGTMDFDPGSGTGNLTSSSGLYDAYIHKMSQCQAPLTPVNLTLPTNQKACEGFTATLAAASGTATINWYASATSTIVVGTGSTLAMSSTLTPGTYTFYAEASGCAVSASRADITFTVFSTPTVSIISSNTLICVGESVNLTASGAASFTWNSGATTSVITVSPTQNSTYTVSGTSADNCSGSAVITQNVNECTGIGSVAPDISVAIFPNPGNGIFNISLNESAQISVSNLLGEVVLVQELRPGTGSIDLSSFENGVYLIQISENGKHTSRRVIKN